MKRVAGIGGVFFKAKDPEKLRAWYQKLVHCKQGVDRTGTVIAVYRITHDGWTSEQAKAEANRYGMHPWERAMKNYIRDYYQRHLEERKSVAR